MIWFFVAIVVPYVITMCVLQFGYHRTSIFLAKNLPAEKQFSIVVPFRNEAENLPELLRSFQQLNYPKTHFEILFINDESSDISEEIILQTLKGSQLKYRLLQNTPNQTSPKKTAITLAIEASEYSWIITTDADCTVPENWLNILNDFILTTAPVCVAMPVDYNIQESFLHRYQQLDNWSLQTVTMSSHGLGNILLSNGANFAYQKDAFYAADGFEGNLHIASGDDMFLLEKFKNQFPEKIGYLKSRHAIVTTIPVNSWNRLISQRVRWASKTAGQKSTVTKGLGLLVFLNCIFILTFPTTILLSATTLSITIVLLIAKILSDFLFVRRSAVFFGKKLSFIVLLLSTFVYAAITIYVVFCSLFASYTWKQRTYRK